MFFLLRQPIPQINIFTLGMPPFAPGGGPPGHNGPPPFNADGKFMPPGPPGGGPPPSGFPPSGPPSQHNPSDASGNIGPGGMHPDRMRMMGGR